jgi:hypothetical protein
MPYRVFKIYLSIKLFSSQTCRMALNAEIFIWNQMRYKNIKNWKLKSSSVQILAAIRFRNVLPALLT